MTPAETQYETHDQELVAIVETFETWLHYSKDCKYEAFVLTNHNNLHLAMLKKRLELLIDPRSQVGKAEENTLKDHTKAASHPLPLYQVPISSFESFVVSRPTKIFSRLVGWSYGSWSYR